MFLQCSGLFANIVAHILCSSSCQQKFKQLGYLLFSLAYKLSKLMIWF